MGLPAVWHAGHVSWDRREFLAALGVGSASSLMFAASPAPDSTDTAKPSLISFCTTSGTRVFDFGAVQLIIGVPTMGWVMANTVPES